jgi:hypothetical protein
MIKKLFSCIPATLSKDPNLLKDQNIFEISSVHKLHTPEALSLIQILNMEPKFLESLIFTLDPSLAKDPSIIHEFQPKDGPQKFTFFKLNVVRVDCQLDQLAN